MLEGTRACSISTCKTVIPQGVRWSIDYRATSSIFKLMLWGVVSHRSYAQYLNGWSLMWRLCD